MPHLHAEEGVHTSVVVPAYEAAEYIPILLNALEAQTVVPDEIVIVDSSQARDTENQLKGRHGAVPVVYLSVDFAFPGRARNIGAGIARGKWLAFIDCRTVPEPDWLENALRAASGLGATVVRGLCVSEADTPFKRLIQAATYGNDAWWTLPGTLVEKQFFLRSGGLVETVRAGEDIEWMNRIQALQTAIADVRTPNIRYRGFPKSLPEAMRKWYAYALANAPIEVRNRHKGLYMGLLIALILFLAYRWNAIFASWNMQSIWYLPNVTKIAMGCVALAYLLYRGLVRPLGVGVAASWLLPWRWLAVAFVGFCLDLAKAPGLLWGALLLFKRRLLG